MGWLYFLLTYLRLLYRKWGKIYDRFDTYQIHPIVGDAARNGIVANDIDWKLGSPVVERLENIQIFASNTKDGSSVHLNLKWRPQLEFKDQQLYTLLSQLILETGRNGEIYEYVESLTLPLERTPGDPWIREYRGDKIRLAVIQPYRQYRLVFSGFMRRQNESDSDELVFVKIRLLIHNCGKIFDFKETYDEKFIANQFARQKPSCGLNKGLSLILQDRHEQQIQIKGTYKIFPKNKSENYESNDSSDEKKSTRKEGENKLFCWGFHTRHFLTTTDSKKVSFDHSSKLRCKRIFISASDGTLAHIGCIESIDSKFDPRQRFQFGYGTFRIISTHPIQNIQGVDWDSISSSTTSLDGIVLQCEDLVKKIKMPSEENIADRNVNSRYFDVEFDGLKARATIIINDCMSSDYEDRLIEQSIAYYRQHHSCHSSLSSSLDFDKLKANKPMIVSLDDIECSSSSLCGSKASSLAHLRAFVRHQQQHTSKVQDKVNFRVPAGVVVTRFAYDALLHANPELQDRIRNLLSLVCRDANAQIEIDCTRVCETFGLDPHSPEDTCELRVPQELVDQLMQQMRSTFGPNVGELEFAVRSSAWGEDEDGISAAGQLSTFLCVPGDERNLVRAIMSCFGSKFHHASVEYKRQHSLPIDAPMAVVVQQQIDCERSGVLFTCSPTSGDQQHVLVTVNYGLGESVVSAAAEPDTIRVQTDASFTLVSPYGIESSSNDELSSPVSSWISGCSGPLGLNRRVARVESVEIGRKDQVVTANRIRKQRLRHQENHVLNGDQENQDQTLHCNKDSDDSGIDLKKCCLNDDEALTLAHIGLQLSAYFGDERDIEFGLVHKEDDVVLYVFQARPITSLDLPDEFESMHEFDSGLCGETEYLSRANLGEVMPYALTPLTNTLATRLWSVPGASMFVKKLRKVAINRFSPRVPHEVLDMNGFKFFRMRASGIFQFGSPVGERALSARAMEIGMFGHEVNLPGLRDLARRSTVPETRWCSFFIKIYTIPYRWFTMGTINHISHQIRNLRRDVLKHKFVRTDKPSDLVRQLDRLVPAYSPPWQAHIFMTIISSKYNQVLMDILSRYTTTPSELFSVFSRLMSDNKDILSAGVPRLMDDIAKALMNSGELDEFIRITDKLETMDISSSTKKLPVDTLSSLTQALRLLTRNPKSSVAKYFNEFMEKYGHRGYNEFELEAIPWRNNPSAVVSMLRNSCVSLKGQFETPKHGGKTKETVDEILNSLPKPISITDRWIIKYNILSSCSLMVRARERTKSLIVYAGDCLRDSVHMLAKQMRQSGLLPDDDLIYFFAFDELRQLFDCAPNPDEPPARWPLIVSQAQRRRRMFEKYRTWRFDEIVVGHDFQPMHLTTSDRKEEQERLRNCQRIAGTTSSVGCVEGPVCIVNNYNELVNVKKGDILVTFSTDIAFSPIFPILGGIVTEIGGLISHGAVIAREYGLPSIIGIQDATRIFVNGERVLLDSDAGEIVRLEQKST